MRTLVYLLSILVLLFFSFSCSEDELSYFQANDLERDYKLFDVLDDYPALKSAFENLDQDEFNDFLSEGINKNLSEARDVFYQIDDLVDEKTNILGYSRNILERINNQDKYDRDPVKKFSERSDNYTRDFYEFLDLLSDSDINLTNEVVAILGKVLGYISYTYDGDELEDIMSDLISYIKDNKGNDYPSILGKLLLQANDSMWLGSDGNLLTDHEDILEMGVKDTGVGNAARGMEALLSGIEEKMKDDQFRDTLNEILTEVGNLIGGKIVYGSEEIVLKTVLKDLMCNLEKYNTIGGSVYDSEGSEGNDYNRNTTEDFTNVELGETIRDLVVFLKAFLRRSDRAGTILYDDGAERSRYYLLHEWSKNLKAIGLDFDTNHLDERFYDGIRYDLWGRDRLLPSTGDIATDPFFQSDLNAVIHLLNMGTTAGWNDGGETGEIVGGLLQEDPSIFHGHGTARGLLSLNDALFSLKTRKIPREVLGAPLQAPLLGLYNIALKGEEGHNLFRSVKPFTREERENYKFFYDQNYGVLKMLPSRLSGDVGVPWGGNPDGGDGEPMNSLMPYKEDGTGVSGLGEFCLYLIARSTWNGEGPYYSKEGMTMDVDEDGNNVYVYYRYNGMVNMRITKPDPGNVDTWTYEYPYCGGKDIEDETNPGQRINNRYYDKIESDYCMVEIKNGIEGLSIIPPFIKTKNYYVTPVDLEGDATEAGRVLFNEFIPMRSADRECESNLEVYYRNLQWVVSERKIALLIPFYAGIKIQGDILDLFPGWVQNIIDLLPLDIVPLTQAALFLTAETNGIAGVTQARRVVSTEGINGNGAWAIKRDPETGGFWYGESTYPGDYRIEVTYQGDFLIKMLGGILGSGVVDLIYNQLLGTGTLLPGVIIHACRYFSRVNFPRSVHPVTGEPVDALGSRKGKLLIDKDTGVVHPEWGFEVNDNDPNWRHRGVIPELFLTLLIALRDSSGPGISKEEYYGRGDFELPVNTYATLKGVLDTIIQIVGRPEIYFRVGDADTYPHKGWLPRLVNDNDWFTRTCDVPGSPGPDSWEERAYYQPANVCNLITMLTDSDPFGDETGEMRRCDGLLPLLTEYDVSRGIGPHSEPRTRLLSKIFKMFIVGLADPIPPGRIEEDYTTWSASERIMYGIEQFITTIKCKKTDMVKTFETSYKGRCYGDIYVLPDWVYSDNVIRPEDVNLEEVIEEWVGSDESGTGLASFIDHRDSQHPGYREYNWDNFNKLVDGLGELLSDNGTTEGDYNIMEELITVVNKVFEKVDADEKDIRGLRHTLGSIFTKYNAELAVWEDPGDLDNIIIDEVTKLLEVFKEKNGQKHYDNLLKLACTLMNKEGFVEYFLRELHSDYTSEEVLIDLERFFIDPLIAFTVDNDNEPQLWSDLAGLLNDFADSIDVDSMNGGDHGWGSDLFHSNVDVKASNPYLGLGELLSR